MAGEPCLDSSVGHQTMNLPEGKTCADCVHVRRCTGIFGVSPLDEGCDFFPVRFREQVAQ